MSAYEAYRQRRLAEDEAGLYHLSCPHSPTSPTLLKNRSTQSCPLLLLALPLFLLMTAAPLLSAIFPAHPPSTRPRIAQRAAASVHSPHTVSEPSIATADILPSAASPASPAANFTYSPDSTVLDVPSAFVSKYDETANSFWTAAPCHQGDLGDMDRSADNAGAYTVQQVLNPLSHVRTHLSQCGLELCLAATACGCAQVQWRPFEAGENDTRYATQFDTQRAEHLLAGQADCAED